MQLNWVNNGKKCYTLKSGSKRSFILALETDGYWIEERHGKTVIVRSPEGKEKEILARRLNQKFARIEKRRNEQKRKELEKKVLEILKKKKVNIYNDIVDTTSYGEYYNRQLDLFGERVLTEEEYKKHRLWVCCLLKK